MAREESRGTRPLKIWDSWRNVRKGLVVSSFEELLVRGRDKLGVSANEPVRIVLESDGTQIEDGEYFRTLANNTILLLLRQGERWYPTGVDVIKAAISAIPKIVCETIHALELHDETPSWKIMDNKGRVTVVLHWDQRQGGSAATNSINGITQGFSSISCGGGGIGGIGGGGGGSNTNGLSSDKYSPSKKGVSAQNSLDKSSVTQPQRYPSPQITVINHDDMQSNIYHTSSSLASINRRLAKGLGGGGSGAGSFDSTIGGGAVHVHTPECAHHVHTPHSRAGSPSAIECDFHCCSLHEEGRQIAVHKNVATSPIQDGMGGSPQPSYTGNLSDSSCTGGGGGGGGLSSGRRSSSTKGHVRFLNVGPDRESSESETDNTALEDEFMQTEKYLLLVDQLSVDQKRHLSIKDIGIILERLSAKIVDVERLDRECDADDSYNWTIKTTIRGDSLNDLGIIYNSNYYSISEHPGYKEENRVANQREEPEERL